MTTKIKPVTGKIAKVLNSREIALNVGSVHGVKVGMLFDVLHPEGFEIHDPDTGEILGSVASPKVRVRIARVQERLSVASTCKAKSVNTQAIKDWRDLFEPPNWENRYETLKIERPFERDIKEMDEADSYVSTGDPVVQALDHRA
jgi:hypothetical protein